MGHRSPSHVALLNHTGGYAARQPDPLEASITASLGRRGTVQLTGWVTAARGDNCTDSPASGAEWAGPLYGSQPRREVISPSMTTARAIGRWSRLGKLP